MTSSESQSLPSGTARSAGLLAGVLAGILLLILLRVPPPTGPDVAWIEENLTATEIANVHQIAEQVASTGGGVPESTPELRDRAGALSVREAAALGTLLLDSGHPDPAAWLKRSHEREVAALARLQELQRQIGYREPGITYLETTVRGPQRLRDAVGEEMLTEVTGAAMLAFYDGGIPAATDFSDQNVQILLDLPGLEWIHADWSKLTDAGVIRLASLPRLKELRIAGADVGDPSLTALGAGEVLRVLDVSGTKGVTDAGVAALDRCRDLEVLNLSGTGITSRSLPTISRFRQLRELALSDTGVRRGLWRLGVLKRLERLELGGLGSRGDPLTAADFEFLSRLQNLKFLSVADTWTRQLEVAGLPELVQLYLGSPLLRELTLEDLPKVQSLRFRPDPGTAEPFRLESLSIDRMESLLQVSLPHLERDAAAGFAKGLATLPRLEILHLDGTLTAALAASIGQSAELATLDLGDAAVTDGQLVSLVEAPKLQHLTLDGGELTEEGLRAVAAASALSRLTILDLDVETADFGFRSDAGVAVQLNGGRIGTLRLDADNRVRSLYLIGTTVRDLDVRNCRVLTGLNLLEVAIDRVTVEACPHLEGFFCGYESTIGTLRLSDLPRLEAITIQERANPGKMVWSKLPAVRRVSFWAADIDERHIQMLLRLPELRDVDLSGTALGDEAAAILSRITTLQRISASGHFQLAALERLATLPQLRNLLLYHHDGVDWMPQQARQLFDHLRGVVVF